MPLDVAILDEDERPVVTRSIGVREHEALMNCARAVGAKYLARMHDYYADAEIAVDELPAFQAELKSLLKGPGAAQEMIDLIEVLVSLSVRAMSERRKIVAIAD